MQICGIGHSLTMWPSTPQRRHAMGGASGQSFEKWPCLSQTRQVMLLASRGLGQSIFWWLLNSFCQIASCEVQSQKEAHPVWPQLKQARSSPPPPPWSAAAPPSPLATPPVLKPSVPLVAKPLVVSPAPQASPLEADLMGMSQPEPGAMSDMIAEV